MKNNKELHCSRSREEKWVTNIRYVAPIAMRKMNVPARSRSDEKPSREIGPPIPFKFTQLDPLQPYSWEKKIKKQGRSRSREEIKNRNSINSTVQDLLQVREDQEEAVEVWEDQEEAVAVRKRVERVILPP